MSSPDTYSSLAPAVRRSKRLVARAALLALVVGAWLTLPQGAAGAAAAPAKEIVLSGTARATELSLGGSLFVIGTSDGVFAFTPSGTQVFHALPGDDIVSVAVDRLGDRVVAGDADGRVHFLDGQGTELATALAAVPVTGAAVPVTEVAISADGSVATAAAQSYVYGFALGNAVPPPVPPQSPLAGMLFPQWTFRTTAAVSGLTMTFDGSTVDAANHDNGRVWSMDNSSALLPGTSTPSEFLFPCVSVSPVGPKCPSGQLITSLLGRPTVLVIAPKSYDLLVGTDGGSIYGTLAQNFGQSPWFFQTTAPISAGGLSQDGSRAAVGDAVGRIYYLDLTSGPRNKTASWSYHFESPVVGAAISPGGRFIAAADGDSNVALFDATPDDPQVDPSKPIWTYAAGATITGLAVTPSGAVLGASGTKAFFQT